MLKTLNTRWPVNLATLVLLSGCGPALQTPACPVGTDTIDKRSGNAGCLIVNRGQILVLRHQPTGKIGLPGGTPRAGESAACTAHRETFEETGLNVAVGAFVAQMNNGFLVYACQLPDSGYSQEFTVPSHARREVQQIFWANLSEQSANNWRFPMQLEEIRVHMESATPQ